MRASHVPACYWAILLLTALLALLTWAVFRGATRQLDLGAFQGISGHVDARMSRLLKRATGCGVAAILLAPCLTVALLGRRRRGAIIVILASEVGAAITNAVLKAAFQRPAPGVDQPEQLAGSSVLAHASAPIGSWYSYPSGHVVGAVVSFGLLAYVAGRERSPVTRVLLGVLSVAGVVLLGLGRVALARHYPSDVLGGALLGGLWFLGSLEVLRRS